MRIPYPLTAAGLTAAALLTTCLPAAASWVAASSAASAKGAATTLPAGSTPGSSVAGSTITSSWSALTVATGVAVRGYRVTRYNATTGASVTPAGTCAGVVTTTTCQDTSVPDGRWRYAVQALQGTNWVGAAGAQSTAVQVSTGDVTVTFPAANGKYPNSGKWDGCSPPGFCGKATAGGGASLTAVRYSVRLTGGNYWNGTSFASATEVLFAAGGTLSDWKVAFPYANLPGGNPNGFTLRVVATDDAGGAPERSVVFTN